MDRAQRLLAWLLGAQIALLAILHAPWARHGAAAAGPFLPALSSFTPQMLEISGGDGAKVTLVRRGGGWTLGDPAGYPALADKVTGLLQNLKHLTTGRQVVSARRYHATLKVADDAFERRVRVWEKPGGAPRIELFVGTSPGADVTHMRLSGNDKVFEVSGLSTYDLPIETGSWVERRLVDWKADDVSGVEITNRRGSFALSKSAGAWTVRAPAAHARAELDPAKVSDLVSSLCALSLDSPAGAVNEKAQGLDRPEATVTLERAPGAASASRSRLTLRIGGMVPGKDGQRYGVLGGSAFAITLDRWAVDRPDTVTIGDLTKAPPKPVAAKQEPAKN